MPVADFPSGIERLLRRADSTVPIRMNYVYQMSELSSYIQLGGGRVYHPLMYNEQHHQGYIIFITTMGVPSYAPVQVVPVIANMPLTEVRHPQQIVYSMQQCQLVSQNWSRSTTSPNAVPCLMHPLPYPQ